MCIIEINCDRDGIVDYQRSNRIFKNYDIDYIYKNKIVL